MGRSYWSWRQQLDVARNWPADSVADWQLVHLREIVRHAYERTPGYRVLFTQNSFHPRELSSLDDIHRIPFTTKQMFQERLESFTVKGKPGEYTTTGGSTGIPFGFYAPVADRARENAFIHAVWSNVGWKLGCVNAVLRGGFIGTQEKPWEYDPYHRQLLLSSYYLTDRTLGVYLDVLRRFRPPVLQAYPSALNLLCRLLEAGDLAGGLSFDLILLGSEDIYPWQLAQFERIFPKTKLFGWYGHAEKAGFAHWCAGSRLYHVHPLYGYVELLRDDGSEAEEGEEGEIVATGFYNTCTPIIRYRTMDRAVRGSARCEVCGHSHLLFSHIVGRSHELIVTRTRRMISMTAINMHDAIFDPLRQFQFFQEEPGKVTFRYVSKSPLGTEQEQRIRAGLMAKLGSDVELSLHSVETIPRRASGKVSFLDQRLPIGEGFLPLARAG